MANPLTGALLRRAENLRFPRLAMLMAALFALDLVIPDVLPFIDEILLGLATLMLANLRKRGAVARKD